MDLTKKQRENSDYESLWDICFQYGDVLQDNSDGLFLLPSRPESDLGLPKRIIKRALSTLILIEGNSDAVSTLSSVFLLLDDFVEDQIYYYLLPYSKTIEEFGRNPTAFTEQVADPFRDQEFLKTFNGVVEMLKQRWESSIDEVNYLLYLAERDELVIDKETRIKAKENLIKAKKVDGVASSQAVAQTLR